jgi:hypothetical protein
MKPLNGLNISNFSLDAFTKQSDLIFLDGPLLSHFKDKHGRDFIFYWVDNNEIYNRWIVKEVQSESLIDYLSGKIALKELLISENFKTLLVTDIDVNLRIANTVQLYQEELDVEYIPEDNIFYKIQPPNIYSKSIFDAHKTYERRHALVLNSCKWRLVPSESDKVKFANTLSIDYVYKFLGYIIKSVKAFELADFEMTFEGLLKGKTMERALSGILASKNYRLYEVKNKSFEVTLSLDNWFTEDKKIKDWQSTVASKYTEKVISLDYSDPKTIKKIEENFPNSEHRKGIFAPYIKMLSIPNTKVEVYSSDLKKKKIYSKVNLETITAIASIERESELRDIEDQSTKILTLMTEVKSELLKGGASDALILKSIKTIISKQILKTSTWEIDFISDAAYLLIKPITYQYESEELINVGTIDRLNIEETGTSKEDVENQLKERIKQKLVTFKEYPKNLNYDEQIFLKEHFDINP